jgi:mono/diheme cytochrome c family protein
MRRFILAAALALPAVPLAADPGRGRDLYELHCQGCHAESVHARARRTAKTFDEVRHWVARWNTTLALRWTDEEIDDVTLHLNARYYRYPCPPTACKVVSQASNPSPTRR